MLSSSLSKRITRSFLCALATSAAAVLAQTRPINDTGQTLCYDGANAPAACSATLGGDGGVNPRQDGRYGRDAAAAAGQLTKIGAGDAGFDFTKIANNGSALPASAVLGSGSTDWACTRDNVTGLTWEVKTSSGLRSSAHNYSWYSTDATSNGGDAGGLGTDTCGGTLSAPLYNNQCNTQNFTAAVNAVRLCGRSDWRVPRSNELLSIVNAGRAGPAIDVAYFPNTSGTLEVSFWSASIYAGSPDLARSINFYIGRPYSFFKSTILATRLVRGGQ